MKFAAITLLLATLTLANPAPAPIAEPELAEVAVAQHKSPFAALAARVEAQEIDAREAGIHLDRKNLEARKSKPKGGSNGNTTDNSAAMSITPSSALQLGALGLGVLEIVRLWG